MKLLVGIAIGLVLSLASMDVTNVVLDRLEDNYMAKCEPKNEEEYNSICRKGYREKYPIRSKISLWLVAPGLGTANALRGACVKAGSVINGYEYKGREYFGCNKIEIFISDVLYGENGENGERY